ncbi:hypothetical protein Hdeb2414_s0008g00290801 [Helianthus debilis subsp. tardiflorus]
MEIQIAFQNYGTVGIGDPCGFENLVGVHHLEVLAYLLPLCNEDTSPVTPALIFRGVTEISLPYYWQEDQIIFIYLSGLL